MRVFVMQEYGLYVAVFRVSLLVVMHRIFYVCLDIELYTAGWSKSTVYVLWGEKSPLHTCSTIRFRGSLETN